MGCLAVMACEGGAQEGAGKLSGRVTAYGIFAVAEDKPSEAGGEGGVSSLKLLKTGERIPAKVGTSFGFCYEISGFPTDGEVLLSETAIHPAMKRPDGEVRYSFTLPRTVRVSEGVGRSCSGYSFEQPYEVRRGRWRFTLSHQAQTLVVQEFEVK